MFTPRQVATVAWLTGIPGATYCIYKNYKELGETKDAHLSIVFGVAICVLISFLPDDIPSGVFGIELIFAYFYSAHVKSHHMTYEEIESSQRYEFRNDWKVVLIIAIPFAMIIWLFTL